MTGFNSSPLKCLITGFGPFPGMPVNPSELLIRELVRLQPKEFDKYAVRMEILPTQWALSLLRLDEMYAQFNPDLTIHFGVSENARGFQLEQCARNQISTKPDAAGLVYSGEIKFPDEIKNVSKSIDMECVTDVLWESKLPAYLSTNAGDYICNSVYYHSLSVAQTTNRSMRALFIHIPPHSEASGPEPSPPNSVLSLEQLTVGAIKSITAVLEQIDFQSCTEISQIIME